MTFLAAYFVVTCVLLAIVVIALWRAPAGPDSDILLFAGIPIAFFWPLVAIYLIFIGIVAGLHWLVDRFRID